MDVVAEILGLFHQSDSLSDEQQARLSDLYPQLTDEQVAEVEAGLVGLFDEVHAAGVTAESLTQLRKVAEGVKNVRGLAADRLAAAEQAAIEAAEAEAALAAEVDSIMSEVHPGDPDTDDPPPDEGEPPAPVQEPEPEQGEVVEEAERITQDAASPVTAAAPPARPATTPRAVLAARTPQVRRVQQRTASYGPTIELAGGGTTTDRTDIDVALQRRWNDLRGMGHESAGRHRVASVVQQFPENRVLRRDMEDVSPIVQEIHAKISEPGGVEALTADGGICGPIEHIYDAPQIFQAGRPLRGVPTRFNATRGGLAWTPAVTLGSILSAETPTAGRAMGVITHTQDAAATYNKTVQRIACGTETELYVEANYLQLEFGNWIARFNPERTRQFTDAAEAAFARFEEQRLWAKMLALTTEANAPQRLGATRDLITALNRAAEAYRTRHRMPAGATLEVMMPNWVANLVSDDQVNALQSYPEQFEVGAAWLEARLRERGISVGAWFHDDPNFINTFSSGGAAPAYPTAFKVIMAHPGAFVYADGGVLDLGVVRDATLINDNLFRIFMEEFWNVGMWGVEANSLEFSLCANGASAGSRTPTCGS